jgi:hypothetical protein
MNALEIAIIITLILVVILAIISVDYIKEEIKKSKNGYTDKG